MKTIKAPATSIMNMLQLLFITALLTLFGVTGYTLVQVGSESYSRIITRRDENADARVVTSYITMRARQYDTAGGIRIVDNDGVKTLVFMETDGEEKYETRVYNYEGVLYESHVNAEQPFVAEEGFEIVKVDKVDFDIFEEGGSKKLSISVQTGEGGRQQRDAVINLKAV